MRQEARRGGGRGRHRGGHRGDRDGSRAEAADVLYHLLVLLHVAGVPFDEVKAELERRTAETGLQEKAADGAAHDGPDHAHRASRPTASSPIEEWAKLRADTPMTLSAEEIVALRSLGDPVSLEEVERIYLPISRLLSLYVTATQGLFQATRRFLGTNDGKTPFIIGIGGSVAVGKSTTARILRELLKRWPSAPEGRPRHHRRLPLPQCGAGGRGPDGAQGLSGELRRRRAARLPLRHQGRQAARRARRSIRTSPTTSCRARRSPSTGRTS